MLGIVKEIDGQKKIVPLTTDTGTGAPVGTLISQYKKVPMSGYLYCDGSTFDQNAYPALYMYLGTNVLPDYRECVMVGAEQNTTDTIATHDVYTQGQFKDDQLQRIQGTYTTGVIYNESYGIGPNTYDGAFTSAIGSHYSEYTVSQIVGGSGGTGVKLDSARTTRTGESDTTHGKQKAVYVYIKATSGLAENQRENVLNDVKEYLAWHYKTVSCPGGMSGSIGVPTGYNGNYEYSIFDYKYHVSFHGIHLTSDGTIALGNIATNFGGLSNDSITLDNTSIVYNREITAGDFRIAFRPIPNGIAI